MKKFLLLSFVALFGAASLRAEATRANYVERVETCLAILQEIAEGPNRPSPQAWASAKAVLILNQFKAGFFLGVQDGYGVIMVKKPGGGWSLPVLLNAGAVGVVVPALTAAVIDLAPAGRIGSAMGTYSIGYQFAGGFGAAVWGFVIEHSGFIVAYWAAIAVELVLLLVAVAFRHQLEHQRSAVASP